MKALSRYQKNMPPISERLIQISSKDSTSRLPAINQHCVFTSKSVIKIVKPLSPEKQQINTKSKYLKKLKQVSSLPRALQNLSENIKKYSPLNRHQPSRVKKRTLTQNSKIIFQDDVPVLYSKNQIIDKILQLTRQLQMNKVDYHHYIQTDKNSNKSRFVTQTQMKKASERAHTEEISCSEPLHEVAKDNNKKSQQKNKKVEKETLFRKISKKIQQNASKQVTQLKHIQKKSNKRKKKSKNILNKEKQSTFFNKSIRGWTKYGKISQQIAY